MEGLSECLCEQFYVLPHPLPPNYAYIRLLGNVCCVTGPLYIFSFQKSSLYRKPRQLVAHLLHFHSLKDGGTAVLASEYLKIVAPIFSLVLAVYRKRLTLGSGFRAQFYHLLLDPEQSQFPISLFSYLSPGVILSLPCRIVGKILSDKQCV